MNTPRANNTTPQTTALSEKDSALQVIGVHRPLTLLNTKASPTVSHGLGLSPCACERGK